MTVYRFRFDPESGHANERLLKELTKPSQFGSSLVALAGPREIRTPGHLRCKLSLWPLTFRNYTKLTKYEALEKNAVSEPKMPPLGNLKYSRYSRKASLYWRFSAFSLMEKSGCRYEGEELGSNLLYADQRDGSCPREPAGGGGH